MGSRFRDFMDFAEFLKSGNKICNSRGETFYFDGMHMRDEHGNVTPLPSVLFLADWSKFPREKTEVVKKEDLVTYANNDGRVILVLSDSKQENDLVQSGAYRRITFE
jgi:hypothetical protein